VAIGAVREPRIRHPVPGTVNSVRYHFAPLIIVPSLNVNVPFVFRGPAGGPVRNPPGLGGV